MKRSRTAAWIVAGALALGLAACGGSSSGDGAGGSSSAPPPASTPATTASTTADSSGETGETGGLTPPGVKLALGKEATVGWVPPSTYTGKGGDKAIKLQLTVVSIEKGTIDDFKNIQLKPEEKQSTPYYVKVRLKALERTAPPGTDDPDVTFKAIDDRGQQQGSITFLGTFDRCNDTRVPKGFVKGKSYESCLAYLMPGGGSIDQVQWNSGPSKPNEITPYFEKPIVWGGS